MKPNVLFSQQMSCRFRYALLAGECFGFLASFLISHPLPYIQQTAKTSLTVFGVLIFSNLYTPYHPVEPRPANGKMILTVFLISEQLARKSHR